GGGEGELTAADPAVTGTVPFTNSCSLCAKIAASSSNSTRLSQVMVILREGCMAWPHVVSQIFCRAITEPVKTTSIQYKPAIGKEQSRMRNTIPSTASEAPTNRTSRGELRKTTRPA